MEPEGENPFEYKFDRNIKLNEFRRSSLFLATTTRPASLYSVIKLIIFRFKHPYFLFRCFSMIIILPLYLLSTRIFNCKEGKENWRKKKVKNITLPYREIRSRFSRLSSYHLWNVLAANGKMGNSREISFSLISYCLSKFKVPSIVFERVIILQSDNVFTSLLASTDKIYSYTANNEDCR